VFGGVTDYILKEQRQKWGRLETVERTTGTGRPERGVAKKKREGKPDVSIHSQSTNQQKRSGVYKKRGCERV